MNDSEDTLGQTTNLAIGLLYDRLFTTSKFKYFWQEKLLPPLYSLHARGRGTIPAGSNEVPVSA